MINYWIYYIAVFILCSGLHIMITSDNYIKKIIGLGLFQNSVLVFYIALGKAKDGVVPIDLCNTIDCNHIYTSPIPHVLMLTAIVVGFSTLSVGLALILQIKREFRTINESEIK